MQDFYQSDDEDENDSDDNSGYNTCFALDIEGRIEPPMPGLELRFCLKDILTGLRQNENVMSINNITAEVTLMARISRPGTGYNGFSDSSSSNTGHEELYNRKISARLSLILRKTEDGNIEIIYSFLNGVRREMVVDFGAPKSVIFLMQ